MPEKPELFCLVPGLLKVFKQLDNQQALKFDSINYFFSKADSELCSSDYPHVLSELAGLGIDLENDMPSAAIKARHLNQNVQKNYWLEAHPVTLLPDRDKLILKPADVDLNQTASSAVVKEIAAKLAEHFQAEISQVIISPEGGWLCQLKSPGSIQTTYWQDVVGQHIEGFLPTGNDQRLWRSIMNEMQMFLHMHNADQYGFNALWFNGAGILPDWPGKTGTNSCAFYSDDFLIKSIADYLGSPLHKSVDAMLENPQSTKKLIFADESLLPGFMTKSAENFLNRLQTLDQLLSLAIKRLKSRSLQKVTLHDFSGTCYSLDFRGTLSFWRKRKI